MTLSSIQARHYDTADPIVVTFDDGLICDISPLESRSENLLVLAPGLVDVQVNGYGGQEFNDPELSTSIYADTACIAIKMPRVSTRNKHIGPGGIVTSLESAHL